MSRWVTRPGDSVGVHASVKYTDVLFAGSFKFPTTKVARSVQAAAAGGGPTFDTALGVPSEGLPGGARWPRRDLGDGRGRPCEEVTAGLCPPGGGRKSQGICDDGSA